MSNNTNIVALVVATVALAVGLAFAVNYKQGMDSSQNQMTPNQWQNWNNQPNKPNPVQPSPDVTPTNPRSYQEALDMSRRTGKKVFLFFHADWCTWCKKMERETLSDARVKQALSNYIVYHVDTGKERAVGRKYLVSGIPAYCITDTSERASQRGQGYRTPQEFLDWLSGRRIPNLPDRNPNWPDRNPDNNRPPRRPG